MKTKCYIVSLRDASLLEKLNISMYYIAETKFVLARDCRRKYVPRRNGTFYLTKEELKGAKLYVPNRH